MVAMNVWPTDAADGSVANEARWRKMARHWAPTGVAPGVGGEMVPSLAGTNLTVKNGACWVDGHYCELLGDQVLTVTANGLAVVRFDPAANSAQLLYLDGASVPAQSPTGTYELPIATITGSALLDIRTIAYSSGGEICYVPLTVSTNITATTAAGAQPLHLPGFRYYDGSPIIVEFFCAGVQASPVAGGQVLINLWETNTDLGFMAQVLSTSPTLLSPVLARRRIVPAAGMRNFNTRAWVSPSGTGIVNGGPGTIGAYSPCYLRITRA